MAKIFTADNNANPIRLVKPKVNDESKYFYKHFDDDLSINLIPNFQTKACYHQKYTLSDNPVIQFFSDYSTIICKLYDEFGSEVRSYDVNELETTILNETFKCYESEITFSGLEEAVYQLRVSYVDDDLNKVTYFSEPIEIKDVHENTILIEYQNTENRFSMILSKGWIGKLRVEGAILDFKPGSDDVIYNDEDRNATTLYSLPYRQFKLWLGAAEGLPDWIVDKVNRTFSFNILKLDGDYYSKIEGAKFEAQRVDLYPFSGQSIEIMPVENGFVDIVNTDDLVPNDDEMIQYVKTLKYIGNSTDINIPD